MADDIRQEILDGAMPPHDGEIEQAVLGGVMRRAASGLTFNIVCEPDDFYLLEHRVIYKVIQDLLVRNVPPDLPSVIAELKKNGEFAGGMVSAGYVAALLNAAPTPVHLEHHADIVLKYSKYRKVITICSNAISEAYSRREEPEAICRIIWKVLLKVIGAGEETEREVLAVGVKDLLGELSRGGETLLGWPLPEWLPASFRKAHSAGIQPGSLVVVQGATSSGKSTFAAQLAYSFASDTERGGNVVYVTREEGMRGSGIRALAYYVGKPWGMMLAVPDRWEEFRDMMPDFLKAPGGKAANRYSLIEKTGNWSAIRAQLEAANYSLKESTGQGLGFYVIDYIQRLSTSLEHRVQDLERVANEMKDLAGDTGAIAVLVTQQSKEGRAKWARAIEEAADHVWKLEAVSRGDLKSKAVEVPMYLRIDKNRNGPVYSTKMFWQPAIFAFSGESQVKKDNDSDV